MATVSFSVPDEVEQAFNQAFAGRNKSAVIAELMMRAVEEERQAAVRARAMDELLARRAERPSVGRTEVEHARDEARGWP
jgi:hypothetical protein